MAFSDRMRTVGENHASEPRLKARAQAGAETPLNASEQDTSAPANKKLSIEGFLFLQKDSSNPPLEKRYFFAIKIKY